MVYIYSMIQQVLHHMEDTGKVFGMMLVSITGGEYCIFHWKIRSQVSQTRRTTNRHECSQVSQTRRTTNRHGCSLRTRMRML